ncbi:MAG: Co2+/Mg2+ efflux protein ApaG [Salibacteraceae bacterium]
MFTAVTAGIKISVKATYKPEYSDPRRNNYLFSYQIKIENMSDYTVKLLRRHWFIFDSNGEHRQVEGEGVIGEQPTLAPGDLYSYESACSLTTEIGKMHGTYLMQRKLDNGQFRVRIPEFFMIVPHRLN